jgi:hypothetical protein
LSTPSGLAHPPASDPVLPKASRIPPKTISCICASPEKPPRAGPYTASGRYRLV